MRGKKIFCLCLMTLLIAGYSMDARAEELEGKSDQCVTFTGSKLESNFNGTQFAEDAKNIQPGDTMNFEVDITNSTDAQADWYMTNEVVQSFERNSGANGGAYSYKLSYVDPAGTETVLYNSSTVGGEAVGGAAEKLGLEQTENDSYFYLDRLGKGDRGKILLSIGLDGETLINDYQSTLAQLQLNFAVQEVPTGGGGGGGGGGTVTYQYLNEEGVPLTGTLIDGLGGNAVTSPKTGDTGNLLLWSCIALASGCLLLFLWFGRSRREGKSGEVQNG